MPYFALTYEVVDDFIGKRALYPPQHLQRAPEPRRRA